MNKHFILILLFLLISLTIKATEKPFVFAENSNALCIIALPENAINYEKYAADDLKKYLSEITGATFEIVNESELTDLADSKIIYVGQSDFANKQGINFKNFKDEEWLISRKKDHLIVSGGRPIGTFYAVWSLLNKLGCYALTMDQDAVPKHKKLIYDHPDEQKTPVFAGRLIHDGFPTFAHVANVNAKTIEKYYTWTLRNRINGRQYFKLPPKYVNSVYKISHIPQWHSLNRYVDYKKYFKEHPEYFSMNVAGERVAPIRSDFGGSVCVSNHKVMQITLESLRNMIKKDRLEKKPCDWPLIYDISLLDTISYICLCPNCKAITKEEGSETGLMLRYINFIAIEIKKEYPEIIIRTFAFGPTEMPPTKTMPESNVMIQLCDKFTASDPFRPLNSKFNATAKAYLEKWSNSTKKLMIWDYWNLGNAYFTPPRIETNIDAIQNDLKLFHSLGATDLFLEATRDNNAPQNFIDATYFVANNLMVDPNSNVELLVKIFFKYYYGPAASKMENLFNEIRCGVKNHPKMQTTLVVESWQYTTPKFMFDTYKMLKDLSNSFPENNIYRTRIDFERISVIWAIISRKESYVKYFNDNNVTINNFISECRDLVKKYIRRYPCATPEQFDKEFEKRFQTYTLNLPRPEKFKNISNENFKMIAYPNFTIVEALGSKIVDDPDSSIGKALMSANPNKAYHGVNKVLPGTHKFKTTKFYLENFKYPGAVSLLLTEVPTDEKYHWYSMPSPIELKPSSYFWGHGWAIQANTSNWYVLTDGNPKDNTWDEVWFSAKFTGPEYVKGSTKTNAIFVDMVVAIRNEKK